MCLTRRLICRSTTFTRTPRFWRRFKSERRFLEWFPPLLFGFLLSFKIKVRYQFCIYHELMSVTLLPSLQCFTILQSQTYPHLLNTRRRRRLPKALFNVGRCSRALRVCPRNVCALFDFFCSRFARLHDMSCRHANTEGCARLPALDNKPLIGVGA